MGFKPTEGGGKPAWFHSKSTPPEKRAAWFIAFNRIRTLNGEDAAPDKCHSRSDSKPLSLADELKAAKRKHRQSVRGKPGEQPKGPKTPLCGTAEEISAESSETGEDSTQHDSKSVRLSKLSGPEYDRVRIKEAGALGILTGTLDREVKAQRPHAEDEAQGSDLVLYEPEQWNYPVDGAELLDEIVATIRTYVVVTAEQARTAALWILASYAFMAFRIFPRLLIKAPSSECGKSTLKEIIGALVTKALLIDNASTAFIFRVIELHKPTMLQ